ncbi:hypothetical protein [Saccharopolyspora rosea]|uniref:Uncharacterized protein n=1 Tax=Saccharopolyspora rosea TaxID=524884 RepID=A0ABW3FQ24_9PSEU|nr:hypothetical protein [Saccharopolyspora rosea]
MSKFEIHDLSVCVVCLHLIANGEFDDGTDGYGVWNKRYHEWETWPTNGDWSKEDAASVMQERAEARPDDTLEVRQYGSALACEIGQREIWGDDVVHLLMGSDCDEECTRHEDPDDCESLDLGFSWSACEGCGSSDGGDRYRAHALIPVDR